MCKARCKPAYFLCVYDRGAGACGRAAAGRVLCALPCACLGIAPPGACPAGFAVGLAASGTEPHALISAFLGIASRRRLGGVSSPHDD